MSKKIKTIHMHYIQSINNKYYDIIIMQNHLFFYTVRKQPVNIIMYGKGIASSDASKKATVDSI